MSSATTKSQKELIAYYTENLEKVIAAHGLCSDYADNAFFLLQAVKSGMKHEDIFEYAEKKTKELHTLALENCNNY